VRAIIWSAVSSNLQLKGDSPYVQIRDAKEVCKHIGWEVVATVEISTLRTDGIGSHIRDMHLP
jgi:hypothetical protein